ncbi:MAG: YkgJ family cysteine cluster protein [Deltaproteobacteria bacterium]|nr:YkgJ family cysteine cluster protein [Deltaproteobacteria bacterium]
MAQKVRAKVRPLLVRPGARYTCFGDGLCCTDIHGLGPLTKRELTQIRRIDPEGGEYNDGFEDYMLRTAADGGCVFQLPDQRCSVHAKRGPEAKPEGCTRFPLGLVATPEGGRITTEHRCPCRTLGDRPELTPEDALPSLVDSAGRPSADDRVKKVKLSAKQKVAFSTYREIESKMLDELAKGRKPAKVLDAKPFPKLHKSDWVLEALELIDSRDGTAFGAALGWFGDTILKLVDGRRPRPPARPWASAFDRAEARPGEPRSSREVFADWIADELWSLGWNDERNLALMRVELATRLAIAEDICKRLRRRGLRPDRSAAEAVTVVELVGESDFWKEIVERMR